MKRILICAALAGGLALAGPAPAQERAGVAIGTLSCHESAGWGFVFGSSHAVHCMFSHGDHAERYDGSISKFGVDVGYQQSGVIVWAVVAPDNSPGPGVLEGHYAGATAKAAVGVGGGANVLVGGLKRSIALQPISIEGATGLNIAAGIGELTLHPHAGD